MVKFLALCLALLASCSRSVADEPSRLRLCILHTADLHGRVDRLPALASFVKAERARLSAAGFKVLHIDCGDFFQGTPEGDLTDGRVVIDAFNAMGVDAVVLGNHDFDRGPKVTEALARQARFPFLAANVRDGRGPPDWVRASLVRKDLQLEILGLAPDAMDRISSRRAREGLNFDDARKSLARHSWTPGVARIVATHLGIDRDRALPLNGIAAVLGGHTHVSGVESLPGGTALLHSGSHGMSIGRLILDGRTARAEVVEIPEGTDSAMEELIESSAGAVRRSMDERLGRLMEDLPRGGPDFDGVSSPLGNLLADLARDQVRAEAAVLLRSSIRSSLLAGSIRKRDVYLAVPFPDTIVAVNVSGAKLRNALERAVAGEERLLVEVSGIEMTYERERPAGRRLLRVEVAGKPIEARRSYRIATLSFMSEPGGYLPGLDPEDSGVTPCEKLAVLFRGESVRPAAYSNRILKAGTR